MTELPRQRTLYTPTQFGGALHAVFPIVAAVVSVVMFLWTPLAVIGVVAVVAGCFAVIAVMQSPFVGLLLLLGIVPFQPFLDFYLPGIGATRFGALLRDGLTILIVFSFVYSRIRDGHKSIRLEFLENLAIGYVVLMLLFVPLAPSLEGGLVGFRNLAFFVILMVIAALTVNTPERLRTLTGVLLAAGLLSALIGIVEAATNRQLFEWIGFDIVSLMGPESLPYVYLGLPRATGGTGNPLEFGLHMAIVGVLCVGFLTAGIQRRRSFVLSVLALSMLDVMLTLSRSACVCLVLGLLLMALLYRKRVLLVPMLLLVVAGIVVSQTPYSAVLMDRMTLQDEGGRTTAVDRVEIWGSVLKKMVSSPLGEGLGTQGGAMLHEHANPELAVTDNYIGDITMQVGILPLLVFAALLGSLCKRFLHLFRSLSDPELRLYAAVGLCTVVMVVANFFASSSFESRVISVTAWTLWGASIHLARIQQVATA